ncbi:iron-siderophore ABC transporter substrate-binding protein [Agrobacterium sp. SOY23]|uniref:iron-siderophore ABC transporter substrate-binding protein n=1 Tax=Agrobacterium sp. SOY23 TaxID=3014555 RepID=UPI0022AFF05B|nr:iron-siderophore ABC transporter substrate-binding protein [Agrobacterium sp. SOY23]MCZ4431400.1 iron-siderophore ABC transporter substrate-binding protein [Agrobacterium sp. SOY23]
MILRSFFILLIGLFASGASAQCPGRSFTSGLYGAPVCVPDTPRRIVVLDPFYNLGMALELGLPLVGAPLMSVQDHELREKADGAMVSDIGEARQPSLERIVALKPDLIIGDAALHSQSYENFKKIAPTALIAAKDWKEHFKTLALLSGKSEEAARMLASYESRVSAIRSKTGSRTMSVLRVTPTGFHVYLDGPAAYAPYVVLRDAGVKRSAYETTEDNTVFKRPEWEDLTLLDGEILLYVVSGKYEAALDDALAARTTSNPFWQMMPAVASGNAHRVKRETWMSFNGIGSANRVLDDIEKYLPGTP